MSLQHLILGILNYGPATGYDLNKVFADSVQHFWNTEQSQIYRALHKLSRDNLVEIEVVRQDDKPNKKIYHISESGKAELQRWLNAPQPLASVHEAWIGQIFFTGQSNPPALADILAARAANLRQSIAFFENVLPQNAAAYADSYQAQQDRLYWEMTIDYGVKKLKFDLAWTEDTLAQIRQDN